MLFYITVLLIFNTPLPWRKSDVQNSKSLPIQDFNTNRKVEVPKAQDFNISKSFRAPCKKLAKKDKNSFKPVLAYSYPIKTYNMANQ